MISVEEKPAVQAGRSARYWDFCMKTGLFHDGMRRIPGVIREWMVAMHSRDALLWDVRSPTSCCDEFRPACLG